MASDDDGGGGGSIDQPREVRRGHLRQTRARLVDDRVRVVRQKRQHRFGEGTRDKGPERAVWSGPLDEARQLYEILGALLDPDESEVDYARD